MPSTTRRSPAAARRLAAAFIILATGGAHLLAADLFITTSPIRAEVVVDGNPAGATPLLLRGLAPGSHVVEIIKPGHYRESRVVALAEDVQSLSLELHPDTFVTSFSAPQTLVNGRSYSRLDARFTLPSGTYRIEGEGASLSLAPAYPHQSAVIALQVATPVLAAISTIATLEDVWLQDKESVLPTPGTIAAWTATAVAGGILLALLADRGHYLERTVVQPYRDPLTASEAESYYRQGDEAFEAGNLTAALAAYSRVVAYGGESELVPPALYKGSRIYQSLDELDLALGGFELLVSEYPVVEYYDSSLKTMADIYVAQERLDLAVATVRRMVFADPLYSREEIDEFIRDAQGGLP